MGTSEVRTQNSTTFELAAPTPAQKGKFFLTLVKTIGCGAPIFAASLGVGAAVGAGAFFALGGAGIAAPVAVPVVIGLGVAIAVGFTFSTLIALVLQYLRLSAQKEYRIQGLACQKGEDLNKAIEWYVKAANVGDVKSLNHLGEIYELLCNPGTPDFKQDTAQTALNYYHEAAAKGSLEGNYNLGRLYYQGWVAARTATPQDFNRIEERKAQVIHHFKKAEQLGLAGDLLQFAKNCMKEIEDAYEEKRDYSIPLTPEVC